MEIRRLLFSVHALRRMAERAITVEEIRETLTKGNMIEDYPEDEPLPSRLYLGKLSTRNLHVVAAMEEEGIFVVITTYEPDPEKWDPTFTKRIER